jgi:hypothetical protein
LSQVAACCFHRATTDRDKFPGVPSWRFSAGLLGKYTAHWDGKLAYSEDRPGRNHVVYTASAEKKPQFSRAAIDKTMDLQITAVIDPGGRRRAGKFWRGLAPGTIRQFQFS